MGRAGKPGGRAGKPDGRALKERTYEILFKGTKVPTLYVVSNRIEHANRAATKIFKRQGIVDLVGADGG